MESETNMMESQLRREIDTLSSSETKLRQRCNELEALLSNEASEKDDYSLKLRTHETRMQALEKQLALTEDEKSDLEIRLGGLTNMLKKNFGININGRTKRIIPTQSSSPVRGYFDDDTESGFSFNGKKPISLYLITLRVNRNSKKILCCDSRTAVTESLVRGLNRILHNYLVCVSRGSCVMK